MVARRSSRRRRRTASPPAHRRGAAAVEFAIVAPIFFMLVVGMIEIGRALMVQQLLINASREGARQASILTSSEAAVIDAVDDFVSGMGVSGVTTTVSPNPGTAAAGTAITVSASVDFADVSWLPAPWFMGEKTLTATSVMRKEGF